MICPHCNQGNIVMLLENAKLHFYVAEVDSSGAEILPLPKLVNPNEAVSKYICDRCGQEFSLQQLKELSTDG